MQITYLLGLRVIFLGWMLVQPLLHFIHRLQLAVFLLTVHEMFSRTQWFRQNRLAHFELYAMVLSHVYSFFSHWLTAFFF